MPATLRRGDRGPTVRRLQTLLNRRERPIPALSVSGEFEAATEQLVIRVQNASGIEPDGIVGRQTWRVLSGLPPSRTRASDESVPRVDDAPWIAVAEGEIGQREIVGARHNRRIIEYHATTGLRATTDEVAWCSSFVNWCLGEVDIDGTDSALASSWLRWGEECEADAGAICVIFNPKAKNTALSRTGNHVGFLLRLTDRHYVILGGNQSNRVKVSSFSRSVWTLKGYRWPSA